MKIRVNSRSDWHFEPVPHLGIVDDELWKAAQDRRQTFEGVRAGKCVRPRRMHSSLGVCGVYGGGWIVIGAGKWGCGTFRMDGSCTNNRTLATSTFEARCSPACANTCSIAISSRSG